VIHSQQRPCRGCEHLPSGHYADRDELAAFLILFCASTDTFCRRSLSGQWVVGVPEAPHSAPGGALIPAPVIAAYQRRHDAELTLTEARSA